jgi:hypothetical protein
MIPHGVDSFYLVLIGQKLTKLWAEKGNYVVYLLYRVRTYNMYTTLVKKIIFFANLF